MRSLKSWIFGQKLGSLVAASLLLAVAAGLLAYQTGYLGHLQERVASFLQESKNTVFADKITQCNSVIANQRFSCYRTAIESYYQGRTPEDDADIAAVLSFRSDDSSYAIFGTNCHTFYHAFGDYIATYAKDLSLEDELNICPYSCTSGCTMGLYKRLALKNGFSNDLLKDFYKKCRSGEENQCAHEIGHLLHDKYVSAVLKVLDEISLKNFGLKYPEEYKYVVAQNNDLNAPFEDCKKIIDKPDLVRQCYTGVGHNLFLFSEFASGNFKPQFDQCAKIAQANQDNCYAFLLFRIGINNAATEFLAGRYDGGKKVCDDAVALIGREDLKYHCYTGLGGGLGLFIDSETSSSLDQQDSSPATEVRLLERATLCDQVEDTFIESCYKGLLGTRFKTWYQGSKYKYPAIDRVLEKLGDRNVTQVVG
jgi:hypothetical protein